MNARTQIIKILALTAMHALKMTYVLMGHVHQATPQTAMIKMFALKTFVM